MHQGNISRKRQNKGQQPYIVDCTDDDWPETQEEKESRWARERQESRLHYEHVLAKAQAKQARNALTSTGSNRPRRSIFGSILGARRDTRDGGAKLAAKANTEQVMFVEDMH